MSLIHQSRYYQRRLVENQHVLPHPLVCFLKEAQWNQDPFPQSSDNIMLLTMSINAAKVTTANIYIFSLLFPLSRYLLQSQKFKLCQEAVRGTLQLSTKAYWGKLCNAIFLSLCQSKISKPLQLRFIRAFKIIIIKASVYLFYTQTNGAMTDTFYNF